MVETILLTGATSGIGKALVETMKNDENYRIIAMGRNQDKLDDLGLEHVYSVDLTNQKELDAILTEIVKTHQIDILINNAGIGLVTPLDEDVVVEKYDSMMDTNVKSIVQITAAILPSMKKRKIGQIINISSEVGLKSNPVAPIYCASKHALEAYSDGLRQQLNQQGENIRVSVIRPGAINTNYWAGRNAPVEKFLTSKEVAETILYIIKSPKTIAIRSIDLESFRK